MKRFLATLLLVLSALSPFGSLASATQGCTVVELYPGYPGYRGVVAGLIGRSDTACLEDLSSKYPKFSRESEDAINREVAEQLGVNGSFETWTWETWAAVGNTRGLDPICYFCLMLDPTSSPVGPEAATGSDPRMQFGLRNALLHYFNQTGSRDPNPNAILELFSASDWDRVRGFIFSESWLPTASELNTSARESQGAWGIAGGFCVVSFRDGYAYTSDYAHYRDQLWSATLGILYSALLAGSELQLNITTATLSNTLSAYLLNATDSSVSFADHFFDDWDC